jgi:hypothetical protein
MTWQQQGRHASVFHFFEFGFHTQHILDGSENLLILCNLSVLNCVRRRVCAHITEIIILEDFKNCIYPVNISEFLHLNVSRDSSVGVATGYRLDFRGSIWIRVTDFSLLHRFETTSGAQPVSYPMGTGVSFPGGKASGA